MRTFGTPQTRSGVFQTERLLDVSHEPPMRGTSQSETPTDSESATVALLVFGHGGSVSPGEGFLDAPARMASFNV